MPPNTHNDDEEKKAAARGRAPAAKPGAVSMSVDQAALLDQRIAEKRGAASYSKSPAPELNRLEQDLAAKQMGRSAAAASTPGAVSASSARAELTSLENDVAAKNRALVARPGATVEALDNRVAAKANSNSKPAEELNNLEAAVQSKIKNGGNSAAARATPGAREALADLEDAVTAKNGTPTARDSEISRLDERIAAKNAAAGPPTPTPRSLQEAEDSVLKKKGDGETDAIPKDNAALEQHPLLGKSEELDSGNQGLLSPATTAGTSEQDLEYGVYGGPEEEGLAVAMAVEEEDEDMFIPSAVEYDPDAKPPMYRNRRFRLYAFLAIVVVIVGTIGAVVGIVTREEERYIPPELPYRETIGIRENVEKVVGSDKLDDRASPYRMALDWITHNDTMQLTPDDSNFMQRYFAAYFYYATSVKRPWYTCSPPVGNETDDCVYKRLVDIDPIEYYDVPWKRWLSKLPECTWAGIYCDEAGQFRAVELSGMNMTGTFPEGTKHFPFLQSLRVNFGELEGPLPRGLEEMKHLANIELQGNKFTGTVPKEWYQSRSAQRINLALNMLTGPIPPDISKMRDLKGFFVMQNMLSGQLPDELGDLKSITYMRLSRNMLAGTIPTTIGNLAEAQDIWLQRNQLIGTIPTEVGMCSRMRDFRVQVNKMYGPIPDELYNMTELDRLDLYDNSFTGTISPLIGSLTDMDTFRIYNNKFSGQLPAELSKLQDMQTIIISGNDITGTVPPSFCQLKSNRSDFFKTFVADCASVNGAVKLECPDGCCSECCNPDGLNCFPVMGD